MNAIKRGDILRKKHTKRAIYYVVEQPLRALPGGEYEVANVRRLRRDGVAIGVGSVVIRVVETGRLVAFDLVAPDDVPEPLRVWCK